MEINDYRLLAAYNNEVNDQMNSIIKMLTNEEWDKNFGGFYTSIHELCSHIYIGDYKWLARFMALGEYTSLKKDFFDKEYSFSEVLFTDMQDYLEKRAELDTIIAAFLNELKEDDLSKTVHFNNTKGIGFDKQLKTCLLHLSHHQTHHRGMISLYLDILGKDNHYSNVYPYGQ